MAEYGTYADLSSFKTTLGETKLSSDEHLRGALEDASRFIDQHCARRFYVTSGVKYFDGTHPEYLLVPDLLSLTSLQTDEDDDRDYDYTWAASDYDLLPYNGYPKGEIRTTPLGSYSFPLLTKAIKLTGSWGFGDGESASPWRATGVTLTVADATTTTVSVSDEHALRVGWTLLVGDEQLYVEELLDELGGDTATVVRGINGTTAAAHAGVAVSRALYPRNVTRACLRLAARAYRLESAPFGVGGAAEMGTMEIVARQDPDFLHWVGPFRAIVVA